MALLISHRYTPLCFCSSCPSITVTALRSLAPSNPIGTHRGLFVFLPKQNGYSTQHLAFHLPDRYTRLRFRGLLAQTKRFTAFSLSTSTPRRYTPFRCCVLAPSPQQNGCSIPPYFIYIRLACIVSLLCSCPETEWLQHFSLCSVYTIGLHRCYPVGIHRPYVRGIFMIFVPKQEHLFHSLGFFVYPVCIHCCCVLLPPPPCESHGAHPSCRSPNYLTSLRASCM